MTQVLEFYPSEASCIQGCVHCPRSISKFQDSNRVDSVSDAQQDIAERVLSIFGAEKPESQLNLSGYIGEYGFELFDDLASFDLSGISFNLGTISRESTELIEDNIARLGRVLPRDTSGKGIFTYGNFQIFDASPHVLSSDLLTQILRKYFHTLQTDTPEVMKKTIGGVNLSANNIPERSFDIGTANHVLDRILDFQKGVPDTFYMGQKLDYYGEKGLFGITSKLVSNDDYNFDVNMRGVKAKKAKKMTFKEAVENSEKADFYISLFPDKIMVYHSPWNIHLERLFFSYDEFDDMLRERTKRRIIWKKRTLREIVNERLRERVKLIED